jgi:hypothetical protein
MDDLFVTVSAFAMRLAEGRESMCARLMCSISIIDEDK